MARSPIGLTETVRCSIAAVNEPIGIPNKVIYEGVEDDLS